MKPSEIKVGNTYKNKGKGRSERHVLAIGDEHRPEIWSGATKPPQEPGVLFEQRGRVSSLYLSSFAAWCGAELAKGE